MRHKQSCSCSQGHLSYQFSKPKMAQRAMGQPWSFQDSSKEFWKKQRRDWCWAAQQHIHSLSRPVKLSKRKEPPSLRLTAQTSHPGSSRAGSSLEQTLYGRLQIPTRVCASLACWWHCSLLAGRTWGTRLGLPASQPSVNLQHAARAQDITAGFSLSSC